MKFIKSFIAFAFVLCAVYYASVLKMIDIPVPAEYWVAEMIAVKKELVKEQAGKRKMIIAGGSSTLFSIDTEYASKQLNMPVINFGLHAGLRLEKILREAGSVVERGDLLILPLEPSYYDCHSKLSLWQINNIVGWDHDAWKEMSYLEKMEFLSSVTPRLFGQMVIANIQRNRHAPIISYRLAALDDSMVIKRFRVRATPAAFGYSAYNLNDHGDLLRTDGSEFSGKGDNPGKPDHVCVDTARYLATFLESMRARGVQVYFANTPHLASADGLDALRRGESIFLNEFTRLGCIIDRREDMVFDRKYFFNANNHLNAEGRSIRTDLLIQAIRNNVLSGACGH